MNILLVCKGNICRSAAAEAVLSALSANKLFVRSRGTRDWHEGKGANAVMCSVALERGYDLGSHVAHGVTSEDTVWADRILAFDAETLRALTERFPKMPSEQVALFSGDGRDIADPYGHSEDAFHVCFDEIEIRARELLKLLIQ